MYSVLKITELLSYSVVSAREKGTQFYFPFSQFLSIQVVGGLVEAIEQFRQATR
jgi:hypothetical protein